MLLELAPSFLGCDYFICLYCDSEFQTQSFFRLASQSDSDSIKYLFHWHLTQKSSTKILWQDAAGIFFIVVLS